MHKKILFKILNILIAFLNYPILQPVDCEVYTSTDQLETLLNAKAIFIKTMKDYVQNQERVINQIQQNIKNYEKSYNLAKVNVSAYIHNPINAFLLTKSLTSDLENILDLMSQSVDKADNEIRVQEKSIFPNEKDLKGAALALIRLQHIYKLKTEDLIKGKIKEMKTDETISATDCFELGVESHKKKFYDYAIEWMNEAIQRSNGTFSDEWKDEANLTIIMSYYKKKKFQKSLEMINELLQKKPNDETLLGLKQSCEEKLKAIPIQKKSKERPKSDPRIYDKYQREVYEKLCRKEIGPTAEQQIPLRCRYISNTPYLKLAPFKVEEIHLNPNLLLYHDVISDTEIEFLKESSIQNLARAATGTMDSPEFSDYRTSKLSWIPDSYHKLIEKISKRVEHMTGLTCKSAELLQVVNYGIGGQYQPHFDFDEFRTVEDKGNNERIATVLFYLTDVAEGGGTVFPFLKTGVWPKKGTAAFWYNLLQSGDVDFRTLHAACPVLRGSKWVANKWLREHFQEFIRPCPLIRDDDMIGDIYAIADSLFEN